MALNFRVELVWQGETASERKPGERKPAGTASSIYLTADGRVVLQGQPVSEAERATLDLPRDAELISVDRALIQAIKDML